MVVKLNSGVDYRGVLACLDGYMNIAMEQTEEYVNGSLKAKYGDCFIRGNNGNFSLRFRDSPLGEKHQCKLTNETKQRSSAHLLLSSGSSVNISASLALPSLAKI